MLHFLQSCEHAITTMFLSQKAPSRLSSQQQGLTQHLNMLEF